MLHGNYNKGGTMRSILFVLLLAGCATGVIEELSTPSLDVFKDQGGTVVVRQLGVGASGPDEPVHGLGAEWSQRAPDLVYVTAVMKGSQTITGLAFIADGRLLGDLKAIGDTTEAEGGGGIKMTVSSRRFAMQWPDFEALAGAQAVKMRIARINDYSESSFGQGSLISSKLRPFVQQVRAMRAGHK